MDFINVYEDTYRADSYATLAFPGTYYLAYRDIPGLIEQFVTGKTALDFGCGTGRSTRFLKDLGFHGMGIDISSEMISHAKSMDMEKRNSLHPGASIYLASVMCSTLYCWNLLLKNSI